MSTYYKDRGWTYRIVGWGLRRRFTRENDGRRYQWWPIRLAWADRRMPFRHRWRYRSLLSWHGVEVGHEHFPFAVPNARRQVLPNPSWPGQHYERWERTLYAQVWHFGALLIICGEERHPRESRLTDDHIREIEHLGRTVAG